MGTGALLLLFIIQLLPTCFSLPSDPTQVLKALISMSDVSFNNDMVHTFEGFNGDTNDLWDGVAAVDPKEINKKEVSQEEERQKTENEMVKEIVKETMKETLGEDSSPTELSDEYVFDEIYQTLKMVDMKDDDQECEEICNEMVDCDKWTLEENGTCALHHYNPIIDCTPPYEPLGRTCVYVVEEQATWEEAWAHCKTHHETNGRLFEMDRHHNELKRLKAYIEEHHSKIGMKGLFIGADAYDPPEWHWNTTGTPFDDEFPWGYHRPIGTFKQHWRECLQISCNAEGACMYEDVHCKEKHPYICQETGTKKALQACPTPFVWMDGQCVMFLEQRVTFNGAVHRCRQMKGQLLEPRNPELFKEYVFTRFGTPHHPRGIWLGAKLEMPRWVWSSSGRHVPNTWPWGKEKEDPTMILNEECMIIYANRGMPFTYDDSNCMAKAFFVCECEVQEQQHRCKPPYEKIGEQCLLVVEERRNWVKAQESCIMDYDGRLAEIRDAENFRKFMHRHHCKKRLFLKHTRNSNQTCSPMVEYDPEDSQQEYWLGARAKKVLWRWNTTGQVIPRQFPWGEGEPTGSYDGHSEECMNLFSNGQYKWKYNDAHCSKRFFFACELPDKIKPANLTVGNIFLGISAFNYSSKYMKKDSGEFDLLGDEQDLVNTNGTVSEEVDLEHFVLPEGAKCEDHDKGCYNWKGKGWCEFLQVKEKCWLSCGLCHAHVAHG